MANSTTIQARIDSDTKEKAKGILISEIACAQDINEKEALSEVESYFI